MGRKRKSMATRVSKSKASPAGHLHGNESDEPNTSAISSHEATHVRKAKDSPAGHLHGNKSDEPITFISNGITIRCAKETLSVLTRGNYAEESRRISSNYVDRLKIIKRNPNLTVAEADSVMAFLKDPTAASNKVKSEELHSNSKGHTFVKQEVETEHELFL